MKCIIADAGPIISLCKIGRLNLLMQLFKPCYITQAVYNEVVAGNDIAVDCLKSAVDFIQVIIESPHPVAPDLVTILDDGEATSITLALNKGNCALLIDEAQGRHIAKQLKIPIIGLAGLLVLAKEKQLINAVMPLLVDIRRNDYWLSDKLLQGIAKKAKEKWEDN